MLSTLSETNADCLRRRNGAIISLKVRYEVVLPALKDNDE